MSKRNIIAIFVVVVVVAYSYCLVGFVDGCRVNKSKMVGEQQKLDYKRLIPIARHSLDDDQLEALVATLPPPITRAAGHHLGPTRRRPTVTTPATLPPTVASIAFLWNRKYYRYPRDFFKAVRVKSCKYTGVPMAGIVRSSCDEFIKVYLKKTHWDPKTFEVRPTWPIPLKYGVTLAPLLHTVDSYEDEELHQHLDYHHDKDHSKSQEIEFIDDYYRLHDGDDNDENKAKTKGKMATTTPTVVKR